MNEELNTQENTSIPPDNEPIESSIDIENLDSEIVEILTAPVEHEEISFFQGTEKIGGQDCIEKIKQKIAELSNVKNINFLLGAGTSSQAIPDMKAMQKKICSKISTLNDEQQLQYKKINSDNLEKTLNVLYAQKHYLEGCSPKKPASEDPDSEQVAPPNSNKELNNTDTLIHFIQKEIFSEINIDLSSNSLINQVSTTLELYKRFYHKTALRNKDLSRLNIFTTNNDLFNEKALDNLNINYNNGFGGGHERVFNPARFRYTFSKKIDANLEKFEPIENMVYLYKLHGSISWVEKEGNSLFDIQEISPNGVNMDDFGNDRVLIYPTPLKQNQSLGSPYADLMREFQTKLALPNSVLFIIGYSFSDEHLNHIVYQTLASNSSISIFIFGKYEDKPLAKINDSRIYRAFGTNNENKKIHYFEYIVDCLLPNSDENKDKALIDTFIKALKGMEKESGPR